VRYWLISDEREALRGMRLAGVSGELVAGEAEAAAAASRAFSDDTIAVVLMTSTVAQWLSGVVQQHKLSGKRPLLAVIPGPDGDLGQYSITDLIQQAIGVKL